MKSLKKLYTLQVFLSSFAVYGIQNNFCEKTLKVLPVQEKFITCPVVSYKQGSSEHSLVPYDYSLKKYNIKSFNLKHQVVTGSFAIFCFAKIVKKIKIFFKNSRS